MDGMGVEFFEQEGTVSIGAPERDSQTALEQPVSRKWT
jgi:hypothetical protein